MLRMHIADNMLRRIVPRTPRCCVHAPRAYWKGFLRLSLVTTGVHVYNAIESKSEISFRQIHKPTGRRVNYQKIVQGAGSVEARGAAVQHPQRPCQGLPLHTPQSSAMRPSTNR